MHEMLETALKGNKITCNYMRNLKSLKVASGVRAQEVF